MRTVLQHLETCLGYVAPLDPLEVLLPDAVGCVLAETVLAPFDRPVTDVATGDGYAVLARDVAAATADAPVVLDVIAELRAGDTTPAVIVPGSAIRIASGAPIPTHADAVIPLADTDHGLQQVGIYVPAGEGEGVLRRGEDVAQGAQILAAGERVGARQVALLASVGRLRVRVRPRPRVVILSIGDELVEPGDAGKPGTVFDANGHSLSTAVADADADTFRVAAVPDEPGILRQTLEDQLVRADVIITTGGLSYGSGDTVKDVLSPLGSVRFDNVAMTPGKQFGIGTVEDVPIFCLPGDPVAALISYEIFVRPALRKMAGWDNYYRPAIQARVDSGWYSPQGRRQLVCVRLSGNSQKGYQAQVTGDPHKLLLSALAGANALAVIPEDVTEVQPGEHLMCMVLD